MKVTIAASPIVKILKIFGFIPIFIDKDGVLANLINFSFLIFSITIWTKNLIIRLSAVNLLFEAQVLSILGLKLRIILPYCLIILLIFGSLVGRKKMQNIILAFDAFDEKVSEFFLFNNR